MVLLAAALVLLPLVVVAAQPGNDKPEWMEARWITLAKSALDYHDSDRFGTAIETFDKAIAIEPRSPNVHYNRALSAFQLSRFEEAVEGHRRTIALDAGPDVRSSARSTIGAILANHMHRPEEAVAYLAQAVGPGSWLDGRRRHASFSLGHYRWGTILNDFLGRPQARQDSAEDFCRLKVQHCTPLGWILIPAYCSANP